MTAVTVTALVATVAASALRAGLDVRERVQRHRTTLEAESRATEWLTNMLRHPPAPTAVNEPLLTITRANTPASTLTTTPASARLSGAAVDEGNDALTFLSQGAESPLGIGPIWRITLFAQSDGLHIRATPMNASSNRVPMETVLPHVGGLVAEALDANGGPSNSPVWRRDWPVLRTVPRALRLTFVAREGASRAPIVFSISPLTGGAL